MTARLTYALARWGAPLLGALVFLWSGVSQAQSAAYHPNHFEPAMGPQNFLTVPSGQTLDHLQPSFELWFDYQHKAASLSETRSSGGVISNGSTDLVDSAFRAYLTGAIGLGKRFQVGLGVPVILHLSSPSNALSMAGQLPGNFSGTYLGDLLVEGKLRVWEGGRGFALALLPGLTLPTGDDGKFAGEPNVTGRIRLAASFGVGRFQAGAYAGSLFRETIVLARGNNNSEISLGHQLMYGAALGVDLAPTRRPIWAMVELTGRHGYNSYLDSAPLEVDAGIRFGLPKSLSLTIGGGTGVVRGLGAPVFRGFVGLRYASDRRDRDGDGISDGDDVCPDQPEDRDGLSDSDGCPEADNDADGIDDTEDKCPSQAEDNDNHQDEDGCPDVDNDKDGIDDLHDACPNHAEDGQGKSPKDGCPAGMLDTDRDGIPDVKDKCPDEQEDKDGFEDEDGCPDPDNDKDGVPDTYDECPKVPEDQDGFEDEDGCPDPDNDKDGILDAKDKCPNEKETINGVSDHDGCADFGESAVRLDDKEIAVIKTKALAKPTSAEAKKIFDQVALTVLANTEIKKVIVEVERKSGEKVPVAEQRAKTIVRYLQSRGVPAERIGQQVTGGARLPVRFPIEKDVAKPAK